MIDAGEALELLKQGNARFIRGEVESETASDNLAGHAAREAASGDRNPFAIVVGCSDSRVPAEILFDRGLGDLFVLRVAGNAIAAPHIARIERATDRFGTRLVVVLGHSHCDAVQATLDELRQPAEQRSPELGVVVRQIGPAVEELLSSSLADDAPALLAAAVEANILDSVDRLLHGSEILESQVASGGLAVLGAHYSREDGRVVFFE